MQAACGIADSRPTIYRPRRPESTSLYQLLDQHYSAVKAEWEERFEEQYGFWRGCIDGAVQRYFDCGILENGFARVHCCECGADLLVAFSCKGRGLCPSCGAKRAALTAARLREEVLEKVGHAQWVFTIPKMLRPYFLRHRELLGDLCKAAWETVREMIVTAAAEPVQPGMVATSQTFGSMVNPHPHVHGIASRGGWTNDGRWIPVPWVDPTQAELLFQHKVLSLLRDANLIDQQRIDLLLSWKRTGFSVHNSVTVDPEDPGATERLIRYIMRSPVSLQRLEFEHDAGYVQLRAKGSSDDGFAHHLEQLDPHEAVARILVQIPEPNKHLIHYYGHYASAARARRKRDAVEAQAVPLALPLTSETTSDERKAARKRWAALIRHIYQVDPLVCPRCGGMLKIIAFITELRVIRAILAAVRRSCTSSTARSPRPPPPARAAVDDVH